jgi:hypothetical protein
MTRSGTWRPSAVMAALGVADAIPLIVSFGADAPLSEVRRSTY